MSPSSVTVSSRGVERILSGHVWIYRADVTDDSRAEPGDVVQLIDRKKRFWGQAPYSSKSQIVLPLLTREKPPNELRFAAVKGLAPGSPLSDRKSTQLNSSLEQ